VRRHVHLAAIHLDMAVRNHLTRSGARVRETEMENHVVETRLENLQHLLARNTTALQSLLVNTTELAFEQAVIITELLLFDQAETVIGVLAAGLRAMNARTIIAAFQIFRGAENRSSESAADANARTCITSHIKLFSIVDLRFTRVAFC